MDAERQQVDIMTPPQGHFLTSPFAIAFAGAISLATALGIGRFAFTPLLPMMLHDGTIDLPGGSVLATANYIGYLLGAILAAMQPALLARFKWLPRLPAAGIVRWGLLVTAILAGAMALPFPLLWPSVRFVAGIASSYVFVFSMGWCIAHLSRVDRARLGGLMFTGPGIGITASGFIVGSLNAIPVSAATGWLTFAGLALVMTALVWFIFQGNEPLPAAISVTSTGQPEAHSRAEVTMLVIAYGLAGFGYIITATFLPVIARETLPPSIWIDALWPIFGIGTIIGALLSMLVPKRFDLRNSLAVMYGIQALGVIAAVVSPTAAGFAIGAFFAGLPITTISFFAIQEARRLRPHNAAALIGLITAIYGIGQIVGPPLVTLMLARAPTHAQAFAISLGIASATLILGGIMFAAMARVWPTAPSSLKR